VPVIVIGQAPYPVRVVQPENPAALRVVQRQTILDAMRPAFRRVDALRLDLHPIAGRETELEAIEA
jgi:hypothetical protein